MEATSQTASDGTAIAGPKGLAGWLILPIIHLIASVALNGYTVFDMAWDWNVLVAVVTGQVDPEYRWVIWPARLTLVLSAMLATFALYLLVLLFQKRRELPRLMVWYYFSLLGATLIVSGSILQNPQQWTSSDVIEARGALGQAVIAAVIWIPYFQRSRRVQATFVN